MVRSRREERCSPSTVHRSYRSLWRLIVKNIKFSVQRNTRSASRAAARMIWKTSKIPILLATVNPIGVGAAFAVSESGIVAIGDPRIWGTLLIITLVMLLSTLLGCWARMQAAKLSVQQVPEHSVELNEDEITITNWGGTTIRPWDRFLEIIEYSDSFILVFDRSSYLSMPLNQIPPEAVAILRRELRHLVKSRVANGGQNES